MGFLILHTGLTLHVVSCVERNANMHTDANKMDSRKSRITTVAVVFLVFCALSAVSGQTSIDCYVCNYVVGKGDDQNCANPGTSTPKRSCQWCAATQTIQFDQELVQRFCPLKQPELNNLVARDVSGTLNLSTRRTVCNTALCNGTPFTRKSIARGKQVTCHSYEGVVSNKIKSVGEICPNGACVKTEACDGYCSTSIFPNTSDPTQLVVKLGCSAVCQAYQAYQGLACCDTDRCNSNLAIFTNASRPAVKCFNCTSPTSSDCQGTQIDCPSGLCEVQFSIPPPPPTTLLLFGVRRSCIPDQITGPISISSLKTITIERSVDGAFERKTLSKSCTSNLCNSDTDIPFTWESLVDDKTSSPATTTAQGASGTTPPRGNRGAKLLAGHLLPLLLWLITLR